MFLSYTSFHNCLFSNKYTAQWLQLKDIIFLSVGVGDIDGVQYIYFVSVFILSISNTIGKF